MPPPKAWQACTGKGLGLDADDGEPGAFQLVEYRAEVVGGNL